MIVSTRHDALEANTVKTVTFDFDADTVEVLNRGTDSIYFTINKSVPTVDGNDTEIVPGGTALEVDRKLAGNTVVKMVSVGAPDVSVRVVAR